MLFGRSKSLSGYEQMLWIVISWVRESKAHISVTGAVMRVGIQTFICVWFIVRLDLASWPLG